MVSCCGKYRLMPRLSWCGNWNRACWSAWPGTNNVAQQFATPELLLQSNVTMLLYLTYYVCTEHIPKGCLCSMSRLAVCSNYRREIVESNQLLFMGCSIGPAAVMQPCQSQSKSHKQIRLSRYMLLTIQKKEALVIVCKWHMIIQVFRSLQCKKINFVPMYDLTV